jgi:phage-related protein
MYADSGKLVVWLEGEITTPPSSVPARIEAGRLLRQLQQGESLGTPQSRPMPAIGPRCNELRIVDEGGTWRIFYHLAIDAVVVLQIFKKTTRETPQAVLRNCRRRLKHFQSNS